jgi:hypothetical protein
MLPKLQAIYLDLSYEFFPGDKMTNAGHHDEHAGVHVRRPPMLMRRLTVETVTAIIGRSERRIKDGHTSTSNPINRPLSLRASPSIVDMSS